MMTKEAVQHILRKTLVRVGYFHLTADIYVKVSSPQIDVSTIHTLEGAMTAMYKAGEQCAIWKEEINKDKLK